LLNDPAGQAHYVLLRDAAARNLDTVCAAVGQLLENIALEFSDI
jgi:hypothetical protein